MISRDEEFEQILQACLDLVLSGQENVDSVLRRYPKQADELRSQLEAALWLQSRQEAVSPAPEFMAQSRNRLLKTIQAGPGPPPLGQWESFLARLNQKQLTYQLLAASVVVVCLLLSTVFAAVASQGSIPADPLYPMKISLEKSQLALTFSDASRARLHINFAQRRLSEIQLLVARGDFNRLHQTVDDFASQAKEASELLHSLVGAHPEQALAMARDLYSAMKEQSTILEGLAEAVPPEPKAEISRLSAFTTTFTLDAQGIGAEAEKTVTLTVTPTLISLTPPVDMPTVIATPIPQATDSPIYTPVPATATANSTLPGTEVPTLSNSINDATAFPVITEEPVPTRKPTITKKPLPNPTRRPPRPTKKPK